MKKIGLTGSIGSGKSVVSRIFSCLGIKVYCADLEARKFLENDNIKELFSEKFGREIIGSGNVIDRRKLGEVVFNDKRKLLFLNSIIHPLVKSDFNDWIVQFIDEVYIIHEAAILFESGFDENFDAVITVSAPEEMRVNRVMQRDNVSRKDVLKRSDNQWSNEQKISLADYIILNDEKNLVIPQVIEIHKQLLNQ
jgi:dephospho-CoA kinase